MTVPRLVCTAAVLSAALFSGAALGQQIPLGQAEGARHGGADSPVGSPDAPAPLTFPPERRGIPIPIALVPTGGSVVGEAGLGWSMPLSYVEVNDGLSRRRPRFVSGFAQPEKSGLSKVTVSIAGARQVMIPIDAAGHYRSSVDSQGMQLTRVPNQVGGVDAFELLDGHGRKYRFENIFGVEINFSHWYLTRISDGTGAHVDLDYYPVDQTDLGDPGHSYASELRLKSVRYNFDGSGCAKHTLSFGWQPPEVSRPDEDAYQVSMSAGSPFFRSKVLAEIAILAQGASSCATPEQISRYALRYGEDPDLGLPRLAKIDRFGRAGTTAETVALPVVRYRYGNATEHNANLFSGLSYHNWSLPVPAGASIGTFDTKRCRAGETNVNGVCGCNGGAACTAPGEICCPPASPPNVSGCVASGGFGQFGCQADPNSIISFGETAASLEDIDGDGLPDLVTRDQTWRNVRGQGFAAPTDTFAGLLPSQRPAAIGSHTTGFAGLRYATRHPAHEEVRIQMIDFNGDGRVDILDANDPTNIGRWWLYLNEPTGWRKIELDVGGVVASLYASGHVFDTPQSLPLSRSATGQDYDHVSCDGSYDYDNACHWADDLIYLRTQQKTWVEWKLVDVNGDGYPDLVASHTPAVAHDTNDNSRCDGGYFWVRDCVNTHTVRFPDSELWVFYNHMGAATALAKEKPFADWVPLDQTGWTPAVEEWESTSREVGFFSSGYMEGETWYAGYVADGNSRQNVGLLDLNGDGLPDRVLSGHAGHPDRVSFGTGSGFQGNFTGAYEFPIRSVSVTECDPATNTYDSTVDSAYLDLNGDGIADRVEINRYTSEGTACLGAGAGLGPCKPMRSSGSISRSRVSCSTGYSVTTAGLFDVDGDGRPDFVEIGPNATGAEPTLDVHSLSNVGNGVLQRGALDAGRIVEVTNGYGGNQHYHYANAKQHYASSQVGPDVSHQVPFPEIVLDQSWITDDAADTTKRSVTSYGYGGARMWFDGLSDRWVFRGYERVTSTTGIPWQSAFVRGTGRIVEAYLPSDLAPGYEQNMLFGRTKRITEFTGTLPADATLWLDPDDPQSVWPWSGQTDIVYAEVGTSLPSAPAQSNLWDVATAPQPYHGFESVWMTYGLSDHGDYDLRALSTSVVYPKSTVQRRGSARAPSTSYVETRTQTLSVDSLGRPTLIAHDGDTHDGTDDFCELRSFATPDPAWNVTDALSQVRYRAPALKDGGCGSLGKMLGGQRFYYDDHFQSFTVGAGLFSGRVDERYDLTTGASLGESLSVSVSYVGASGVIDHVTTVSGNGQTIVEQLGAWDPWYLAPGTKTVSSAPATVTLVTGSAYDPTTLELRESHDPNGLVLRHTYDGYGRRTASTYVDPATGVEYVVSVIEYGGETGVAQSYPYSNPIIGVLGDTLSPGGRQVTTRTFHDPVPWTGAVGPALTAAESRTTDTFDGLGRLKHRKAPLGASYANKTMVVTEPVYDELSRVIFRPDPYIEGEAAPHYGTSFLYRGDGFTLCTASGRGLQDQSAASWATSSASGRYAGCTSETFSGYKRMLTISGAVETDPQGGQTYQAFDFIASGALGRPLYKDRFALVSGAPTRTSRVAFAYDQLGHPTTETRYTNAASLTGAVMWATDFDSLGRPLRMREPGSPERSFTYDAAGHQTRVDWVDGTTPRAIATQYDAMGRMVRQSTLASGVESPSSINTLVYDVSSGQPFHTGTTYALGRLTYAHNDAQSVYFGYDSRGKQSFAAWVDSANVRVEQRSTYRVDGSPLQVSYRLPDNNYAAETATYSYDSAQRPSRVDWADALSVKVPFQAVLRDDRGPLRTALFGNGVRIDYSYRAGDRRELTGSTMTTTGGVGTTTFTYDAALRPLARQDNVTFSPARNEVSLFTYDADARIKTAGIRDAVTNVYSQNDSYVYDGLGNLLVLTDPIGTRGFSVTTDTADPDRVCRISGAGITAGTGCNVFYDALGNTVKSPLTGTGVRINSYDALSRATHVGTKTAGLDWTYGPLGDIAEVTTTGSVLDARQDVRYGRGVELSTFKIGTLPSYLFERRYPLPDGSEFVKRGNGSGATFLYVHREPNGAHRVTDATGKVTDETTYRPYGDKRLKSGALASITGDKYGFNGGDTIGDFLVTQVGARLYDGRFGRFLQRDPVVTGRSASLDHPYMFAGANPVSRFDPTGRCNDEGGPCPGDGGLTWPNDTPPPTGGHRSPHFHNLPDANGWLAAWQVQGANNIIASDLNDEMEHRDKLIRGMKMLNTSPFDNSVFHFFSSLAFPGPTLFMDVIEGRIEPGDRSPAIATLRTGVPQSRTYAPPPGRQPALPPGSKPALPPGSQPASPAPPTRPAGLSPRTATEFESVEVNGISFQKQGFNLAGCGANSCVQRSLAEAAHNQGGVAPTTFAGGAPTPLGTVRNLIGAQYPGFVQITATNIEQGVFAVEDLAAGERAIILSQYADGRIGHAFVWDQTSSTKLGQWLTDADMFYIMVLPPP